MVGQCQIDLFVTWRNKRILCYVSPCPDVEAVEVNALSIGQNRWGVNCFLLQPTSCRFWHRWKTFRGQGVLVAPFSSPGWLVPCSPGVDSKSVPLPEDYALWQDTSKGSLASIALFFPSFVFGYFERGLVLGLAFKPLDSFSQYGWSFKVSDAGSNADNISVATVIY